MEPVRNNEVGPVSWLIPAPPARARAGPPPPEFGRPGPDRPLRRVDYHGHSPPGSHGLESHRPLSARRSGPNGGTSSSTGVQSPNNRHRSASSHGTLSPPASPKTLRNSTTLRAWTKIFEVAAHEMYRLCEQDIAQSAATAGTAEGGRSRESGAIERTKAALSSIEFALLEFHSLLRRSAVEARFSADEDEASNGSAMPSPLRKGGVGGVAWVVSTRSPLQPSEAFDAVADILHVLKQYSQYTQSADAGSTTNDKGAHPSTHARGDCNDEGTPSAPASAAAAAVLASLPSPSRPNWHPTSSGREQKRPLAATARAWYPPLPKPTPSSLVVAEHFRRQRAQSDSETAIAALEKRHSSDDDNDDDVAQTSENKTSLKAELDIRSSTAPPASSNVAEAPQNALKTSADETPPVLLTPPVSPKGATEKASSSSIIAPKNAAELASAPWASDLEEKSPMEQPLRASRAVKPPRGFSTPVGQSNNFDVGDDDVASEEVDTEAAVLLARRAVWDEAEAWVSRAEAVMQSRHCNTNGSNSNSASVPQPTADYSSSEEREFGGEAPSSFGMRAGASGKRSSNGTEGSGEGSLSLRSIRNRQDNYSDAPGIRLELPPFLEFASGSSSSSSSGNGCALGGGLEGDHRSLRDDNTEDDEDALSVSGISEAESAWSYEYSSLDGDDVSHLRHYDRPSSAASSPRSLPQARSTCSSSSSGRRSRLNGSSRSRGRSISMPSGGFGATLPLSSEKPVLRGAAAEAAAQEKASLWAANVEGLAAERRARTSRAEERRRAAYAKASGATSFKAQQLQEREARAAAAHTSRQRASVSFAVNNNQKVSEVAFMKSLSSGIFRDQLQRRLQDCEQRILDTTARRQALLQQRVEVAHHSSEKRKKSADSPAGSLSSPHLTSPSLDSHALTSPVSAVTVEELEAAAGIGSASLLDQSSAVSLNDSMAAVKQAAKTAGIAATGTKRQILARLEKAKASSGGNKEMLNGDSMGAKHEGRKTAKAGAAPISMMSGPPPGLPLPSPFSPSTVLPASPPWSPARPSPTATSFPLATSKSTKSTAAAASRRSAGTSGANSSSSGSSGNSRGTEMSAERHAHEVEASERWQQLERRLEVLAKAASSAALRGDKPLFAAGPLTENNNAMPPREEDDEDDDDDEEGAGGRGVTSATTKAAGAAGAPNVNPEQKRKARKAQRKARMKAHQQQRRQRSRNDDSGSQDDEANKVGKIGSNGGSHDHWLNAEAERLRSAYLEVAVVVPSANSKSNLPSKNTEVVQGLSEAVRSLDQALSSATSAFGLHPSDVKLINAPDSNEAEDAAATVSAAAEVAASREGRSIGRSVERCCRVLGELARKMAVAPTPAAAAFAKTNDHRVSDSTCPMATTTTTWEGVAVLLLARATAFTAAILRAPAAAAAAVATTTTTAPLVSEDKGNRNSPCLWGLELHGAALSALALWTERSSTAAEALFTTADHPESCSLPPMLVVVDVLRAELSTYATTKKEVNTSAMPPPSVVKKSKALPLSSQPTPPEPLQPDRWIALGAALATITAALEAKIADDSSLRRAQHVMRQYLTCFATNAATTLAACAPPPLMNANFRMLKVLACAAGASGEVTLSLSDVGNGGSKEELPQLKVHGGGSLWFDHARSSEYESEHLVNVAGETEAAVRSSLVSILRAHRPPSAASTATAQPLPHHHHHRGENSGTEGSFEIPDEVLRLIAEGLACLCAYQRLRCFSSSPPMPLRQPIPMGREEKKARQSKGQSEEKSSKNSKSDALLFSLCCKLLAHLAGPHGWKAEARADLADRRLSAHVCVQELVEVLGYLAPSPPIVLRDKDHHDGNNGAPSASVSLKDEGLNLLESLVRLPADFYFGAKAKKLFPTLISLSAPGGVPNTQRVRVLRQHVDPSLLVATLHNEALCFDRSDNMKFFLSVLAPASQVNGPIASAPETMAKAQEYTISAAAVPWWHWLRAAVSLEKNSLDAP